MLIRNSGYHRLWLAQVASVLGSMGSLVAMPLLVMVLFGSPSRVAAIATAEAISALFVLPLAGLAIDRLGWRSVLVGGDFLRCLAVAALAGAVHAHRVSFALLLAVAIVTSALSVPALAAASVAVRRLVPAGHLPAALSGLQIGTAVATILGPIAGAALFGYSAVLPFAVDALTFLISVLCVGSLRMAQTAQTAPTEPARVPVRWRELVAGLRFLWSVPFTRYIVANAVVVNFALNGVLVVLMINSAAGGHRLETGAVLGAVGAGNLFGAACALPAQRIAPRTLILGALWTVAVAVPLMSALPRAPWSALLLGCCCVAPPAIAVRVGRMLLQLTPAEILGRVQVVYQAVPRLVAATGPIVAALLLGWLPPTGVLLVFGALLVAFALASTGARALRESPVALAAQPQALP